MPTESQLARIAGFNEALARRGLAVTFDGITFTAGDGGPQPVTFTILWEPEGNTFDTFEVSENPRNISRLHILNSDPNIGMIVIGSLLIENESGRRHTVTRREPRDIKTIFT